MNRYLQALLLALALGAFPAWAQAEVYSVAVVPQYTVSKIYRSWKPLLAQLEQETGHSFKLLVYPGFKEFEQDYLKGVPDFIYYNPYHQLTGHQQQGYVPLVRDGQRKLKGIIVVRKDSDLARISDLNGKLIAFPAPNAFAASLYMRALLREREGIDFEARYIDSHSNGYRHVLHGRADAAGGVMRSLDSQPANVRERLKIIYETPGNPPHPIAVHPRIDANVQAQVTEALIRLQDSTAGLKLLAAIQMSSPVKADHERDYAPLGNLGLQRYYKEYE
ncbi:MAG: phosphate/phosphite/phosphonate ABC transporter substrate-binding protein [Gammaproteobacteria bacterium]|nr:phosphate/phosphite/phosphonate ABC transporter substrate-binding protein [Gammaproteobacteria bacterium]